VERPRLVRRLDSDAPLVVVRGVGGSGKTVLLAEWARGRAASVRPGLWISLRAGVASRHAFWSEVADAAGASGLDPEGELLSSAAATLTGDDDARGALVRAFGRLSAGIHLVIDNYECVADDEVHRDLLEILERCDDVRVTVATRSTSGFDAALLPLRVDAEVVGGEALRFSDDEVGLLLAHADLPADSATVDLLQRATDGLALALRAAVAGLGATDTLPAVSVPDGVVAYVAETVNRVVTDDRVRRFLLRVAWPEEVSVDLAVALTGEVRAEEFLDQAEANGLGLWSSGPLARGRMSGAQMWGDRMPGGRMPGDTMPSGQKSGARMPGGSTPAAAGRPTSASGRDNTVFRFSTVVRSALLGELRMSGDELAIVQRSHAEWALSRGLALPALSSAVDSGDLEFASRVARDGWAQLLEHSAPETVALLQTIPLREMRNHPILAMVLGLGFDASGDQRMRAIEMFTLAIAASRVRANQTDPAERFVLMAGESAAYRLTGRYDQAARSGENALCIFEQLTPDDRDDLERNAHHLLGQVGLSLFCAGRLERALEAFRAAFSASTRLADQEARIRPLALIAGTLGLSGDLVALQEPLARLERLERVERVDGVDGTDRQERIGRPPGHEGPGDPQADALHRVARCFDALERFDPVEAQRQVGTPQERAVPEEHRGLFLVLQALVDIASHHQRAGSIALQVALDRTRGGAHPGWVREWLAGLLALQYLAAGRPAKAEGVLESEMSDAPPLALARSVTALLADDPAEAARCLQGATSGREEKPGTSHLDAAIGLVRSAAVLRAGNHELAADLTDEAVALMSDRGLRFAVVFVSDADRAALADNARSHGLEQTARFFDSVAEHRSFLPAAMTRIRLTEREATVLARLVTTGSTAEIAAALFVSVNTVKSQLRSLYRKLGVASRQEALLVAAERGLLER
jgi:LuxR family maltose regulon positive regulatory protein